VTLWLALAQETPKIDTIWPTSLIGLVGSLTAVISFFMLLVSLWRADKKPILAKIAEAQTYFTKELARVEADFTDKVNEQRDHIDSTLDDYHKSVTGEVNGWAKRFEDDHVDIQRHEQVLGDHAGKFIESRSDREQLNRRVDALAREVAENTRETRQLERNLMTQMGEMERRLIDVITGRKRTA
jgi:hypothetical protein